MPSASVAVMETSAESVLWASLVTWTAYTFAKRPSEEWTSTSIVFCPTTRGMSSLTPKVGTTTPSTKTEL